MAKDKSQGEKTEDVTSKSPVRSVENLEGPVSEEKAKEVNGYKGYNNIREQIEDAKKEKGVDIDEDTYTGAKKF